MMQKAVWRLSSTLGRMSEEERDRRRRLRELRQEQQNTLKAIKKRKEARRAGTFKESSPNVGNNNFDQSPIYPSQLMFGGMKARAKSTPKLDQQDYADQDLNSSSNYNWRQSDYCLNLMTGRRQQQHQTQQRRLSSSRLSVAYGSNGSDDQDSGNSSSKATIQDANHGPRVHKNVREMKQRNMMMKKARPHTVAADTDEEVFKQLQDNSWSNSNFKSSCANIRRQLRFEDEEDSSDDDSDDEWNTGEYRGDRLNKMVNKNSNVIRAKINFGRSASVAAMDLGFEEEEDEFER